jgi:hypothetical protein
MSDFAALGATNAPLQLFFIITKENEILKLIYESLPLDPLMSEFTSNSKKQISSREACNY